MHEIQKAFLIIHSIRNEILLGTKHYRKGTVAELHSEKDILIAMRNDDLLIKPSPERQHLFKKD